MDAAHVLIDGLGLLADDAEPMSKALARVFKADPAYAASILEAMKKASDVPSPALREPMCARFAWDFYRQATAPGRVDPDQLGAGLTEEDLRRRDSRDRVAVALGRTLDWREEFVKPFQGASMARAVVQAYGLDQAGVEPLAGTLRRMLDQDLAVATALVDSVRVDKARLGPAPGNRDGLMTLFAAWAYWRHGGKLPGMPGQVQPHLFHRRWLRDCVSKALEERFPQLRAPAAAPQPAAAGKA